MAEWHVLVVGMVGMVGMVVIGGVQWASTLLAVWYVVVVVGMHAEKLG